MDDLEIKNENNDLNNFINSLIKKQQALGFIPESDLSKISEKGVECIRACIDKREELGLDILQIHSLIRYSEDSEFIKECVERRKELGLSTYQISELIIEIEDVDYVKNCIENYNEYDLNSRAIYYSIISINNPEYTKECIKRNQELNIGASNTFFLITKETDKEFQKKCVYKYKELGLTQEQTVKIVENINDLNFTKECVKRNKELGLDKELVVILVLGTENRNYIIECINNSKELGLELVDQLDLLTNLDIEEAIKDRFVYDHFKNINTMDPKFNKWIDLPEDMTIGVEIESSGRAGNVLESIIDKINPGWVAESDASLTNGKELVSPILTGNAKDSTKQIRKSCEILRMLNHENKDECGGHIHIGEKYFTSIESWKNLLEIWGDTEKILYAISNEEGQKPREKIVQYAVPISKDFEEAIQKKSIELKDEDDIKAFIKQIQTNRHSSINFQNIGKAAKDTIEFRISNGTINPDVWVDNINLFGGLIKACEELARIQLKEGDLTEKEEECLNNLEIIKSEGEDDYKKLQALLELTIPNPEYRETYIKRYEVNNQLIMEDQNLSGIIKRNTAEHPFDIINKEQYEKKLKKAREGSER